MATADETLEGEVESLRQDVAVLNEQTHTLATRLYGDLSGGNRFEHTVIYQNGYKHVHPADLIQLRNGELLLMAREGTEHISNDGDVIMLRTTDEEKLLEMAEHATVPVINGLTDRTHPCQLMADVMTFEEHLGPIAGRKIAWSGDGNNMATSWIHAAERFGFELHLACPEELRPPQDVVDWARGQGAKIVVTSDVEAAVADADCVVTDTWISMGGQVSADRHNMLRSYQVDDRLMQRAKKDAIFMHCLPAHRGEEVTPSVIDGPQSAVWDEAENRLHAQKGILYWCLKQ